MIPHDVLFQIALYLPIKDVLFVCENVDEYKPICQQPYFWELRAQRDLGMNPNQFNTLPGVSPYQKYIRYLTDITESLLRVITASPIGNRFDIFRKEGNIHLFLNTFEEEIVRSVPLPRTSNLRLLYQLSPYSVEEMVEYDNETDLTLQEILDMVNELYSRTPIREAEIDDILDKIQATDPAFFEGYTDEFGPFEKARMKFQQGKLVYYRDLFDIAINISLERANDAIRVILK